MSTLPIILIPDPVLKEVAKPVGIVDDDLRKQMDKMLESMYAAPGIGLAANQVGLLNRVFVMDLNSGSDNEEERTPVCMVNPEIIWRSEEPSIWEEGCLSIPEQFAEVERPKTVRVKYVDYQGKEQEGEFSGLASHCVQHEIDHLDGILFIDYLSRLKRNMIVKKVAKMKKNQDIL
ncbi:MAG: peptide deformylase [Alphaproteobacteria bacterium]|mgnify:FL=1|nr:peptide deformylase [Alphaproteobacteria bacterium]|tara:strand:- start:163 stop:690 length:528 start_codon:yes stop_codon:yes gene_type:complete